ncbi:1-aminocyclopropane-1-carboxylate oxidase [Capsicum annuum]|nr:1-aminocyclopropane-1-carboxylate oxidase [Capsicum annuum]
MFIAFSNLYTEYSLKSVNGHLSEKIYIFGDQLKKDDIKLTSSFLRKVISARFGSQAAPAIAVPDKKAAKPADDNDDDDDINFFGKETEEKKKEIETREVAKASTKKKESGKLFILMDIKPWDDKTDIRNLRKLFAVLRWKVFSGEHPNWS